MELELTFENRLDKKYDCYEKIYNDLAKVIFDHLHLDNYFIVEVNLVDEDTIHEINRTYRNVDRVTDVISFAFEDNDEELVNAPVRDLGEIFICIKRAQEQAEEYGHSFEREMGFLFTHGLLHLLGYDHMKKEDEVVMFKIQDEIMEKVGLKR